MIPKALKASFALALFLAGSHAHAASLGLTLADFPDISSGFITVAYDAATDTLTADGFPGSVKLDDGPALDIFDGLFTLVAEITEAGVLVGGTIEISGEIDGEAPGTLITGNLIDFGFPDAGGDPLEFLFEVTGGDLAAAFGPTGGIIMGFTGFDGDFLDDFVNGGSGVADVAAIPLPAPFVLLLSALLGLGATTRRR